jgi:enoyl-CoA hydratase/carnithine racemase
VDPRTGAYDGLRLVWHDAVVEVVLDRAAALNAISLPMSRALALAATRVAADPGVRALVLASASDRAFCVGADLKERAGFTDADFARQRPVSRSAYRALLELPMPTIAAVHGYALGGGFELALCCDLIVADDTAVFGLPEVTLGLVPGGGGTQLLPRRIGIARAIDLVLTGRRIDAEEADRLGIVSRRCAAGEDWTTALALARQVAANAPTAVRLAKRAVWDGADAPMPSAWEIEDAAWQAAAFSAERREGIAAFTERRVPVWPGLSPQPGGSGPEGTRPASPPPPRSAAG